MNKALSIAVCAVIVVLLPSLGLEVRAESVRLAWNPGFQTNAAGYNVYRSDAPGGPYVRVNKSLVQSPFHADNSAEINRTYYYSVTAIDPTGVESGFSSELQVRIGPSGIGPLKGSLLAVAGPDLAVRSGQTVVLSGMGWDPDGSPLVYSWSQISGPNVIIIRRDQSDATFVAPIVSLDNKFSFRVTVTNSQGASATDSLQVVVRRRR